jgi:hypothetical protein
VPRQTLVTERCILFFPRTQVAILDIDCSMCSNLKEGRDSDVIFKTG